MQDALSRFEIRLDDPQCLELLNQPFLQKQSSSDTLLELQFRISLERKVSKTVLTDLLKLPAFDISQMESHYCSILFS
jgi:hypothetical protein